LIYKKIFQKNKKEHVKSFIKSRESVKSKKSDNELKLPEISVKNESRSIEAKKPIRRVIEEKEEGQDKSPRILRLRPSIKASINERRAKERGPYEPAGVQSEVYKKLKLNQYESQSPVKYSYLNCNYMENAYEPPHKQYAAYSNEPKRLYMPSKPVWWG
jgi:hypothetical protein